MLGKFASVSITVFWLAMMTLLAKREIVPKIQATRDLAVSAKYAQFEELLSDLRDSRMGIYSGGQRIGCSTSRVTRNGPELVFASDTEMRLENFVPSGLKFIIPSLSMVGKLHTKMQFQLRSQEGRLVDFRLVVCAPPGETPLLVIEGEPGVEDSLRLNINYAGNTQSENIRFDSRQLVTVQSALGFGLRNPKGGTRWKIRILDPVSLGVRECWVRAVRLERVVLRDGSEHEALLVCVGENDEIKLWVRPDGEVLKQTAYNITFEREEPVVVPTGEKE